MQGGVEYFHAYHSFLVEAPVARYFVHARRSRRGSSPELEEAMNEGPELEKVAEAAGRVWRKSTCISGRGQSGALQGSSARQ